MGIQILSVLAKRSTKLASSAGVTLKTHTICGREFLLPNPQEKPDKYVLEVISQWSAGHSHCRPTWEELLTVIRDIGHKKLSQQIEDFMRSKYFKHFYKPHELVIE